MYYVSEKIVRDLVHQDDVTNSVSDAFVALASDNAVCFPIVRETLDYADATFGFKSGFDRSAPALGVKAGGLWPGNVAKGMANHQSTVVLFDESSGAPAALVRATYLTALRTAAASALSIRHLARGEATTLGIVGAGGQAVFQLDAALKERPFSSVLISDPNEENAAGLAEAAKERGLAADITVPQSLAAQADVIITITPSRQAILEDRWIRDGTHLACMGADTIGKQEVEPELLRRARVFGDVARQAVSLGECQHAFAAGMIGEDDITPLGLVIDGRVQGRTSRDEVTVFDSTGIALQDLAAARLAVKAANDAGRIVILD